jgi:hypothetical protein
MGKVWLDKWRLKFWFVALGRCCLLRCGATSISINYLKDRLTNHQLCPNPLCFPWQFQKSLNAQSDEFSTWGGIKCTQVLAYLLFSSFCFAFDSRIRNKDSSQIINRMTFWCLSCYVLLSGFNKLNHEHNLMLLKTKQGKAASSQSSYKSASLWYFKSIKS